MRLWSLHPKYLDRQGLLALWREGLLAQKVLRGKTRGYKHHPQLTRFRDTKNPVAAIGRYLHAVADEAGRREYEFNRKKILGSSNGRLSIRVGRGQIRYEARHLYSKLKKRDPALYRKLAHLKKMQPHPLFRVSNGGIEPWEKT